MQPATDEIALSLASLGLVWVRPSLRAAYRLERAYGFDKLLKAIAQGNVTAIADVIAEGTNRAVDFLTVIKGKPLVGIIEPLKEPLVRFVLALAGYSPNKRAQGAATSTGNQISFAEHHAKLFKLATGWLGWTPDQAWNATPSEIMDAYSGRLDMLKAIFGDGSGESKGNEISIKDFARKYQGVNRAL